MDSIRCPKCRLINKENSRRCRRCGAALSPGNAGKVQITKPQNVGRINLSIAVPAFGILCLLGIYESNKYSNGPLDSKPATVSVSKTEAGGAPVIRDLQLMEKLHQEFMAQLFRNMADRNGEGFKKNQVLASEEIKLLNQKQYGLTDPAAQSFFHDFYRLVEKFNAQLIEYNSETIHLADIRQQINSEIQKVQDDPSLTPEEKLSIKRDLNGRFFDESQATTVKSSDIDETVNALRGLRVPVRNNDRSQPRSAAMMSS